jgi:hypothetical protein
MPLQFFEFVLFVFLEFELSTLWATPLSLFCVGYFQGRVTPTICLGWLWTKILLIAVSWVARIIGMSHQCLAKKKKKDAIFFIYLFLNFGSVGFKLRALLGRHSTTWATLPALQLIYCISVSHLTKSYFSFLCYVKLGIECRASNVLDKHSTTELYPQLPFFS